MNTPTDRQYAPLEGGFQPARARVTLGVFAKHWTPGETKTRLAASVGEETAAQVAKQLLLTTLKRLTSLSEQGITRRLVYSPVDRESEFEALASELRGAWQVVPQSGGDLGARMKDFLASAMASTGAAVLVGSDSPHLPLESVVESLAWLRDPKADRRLVLGPTNDGGYWLIGASGRLPPVFDSMPWSDPALMEATLDRLEQAGWREGTDYRLLRCWYDIDDTDDLTRLRSDLPSGDAELLRLAATLNDLLGPSPAD